MNVSPVTTADAAIERRPVADPASQAPTAASPSRAVPVSDSSFHDLLRASVEAQYGRFAYYRQLCARRGVAFADLLAFVADGAYDRLPAVASTAFKLSKGLVEELNDLASPGVFQLSSSTSGDPSYVYTSPRDLAHITARYGETFGFPGVSSIGLAFAPSLRILKALSKKGAYKGRPAALRMMLGLEGSLARYERTVTTVDVDVPRTLLNRLAGRPAVVRKMTPAAVAAIVRDAESRGVPLSLGGLTLLLRPYLDEFREGEFHLGDRGHVAFSGGGYSGAKGTIRGAAIDKPAFVARIGAVFGIEPDDWGTNVKDIYSFTETPAQIEGYWSRDLGDFLFRPSPDDRVYIVDPETEEPLRSGRGLVKVVAPSATGEPLAANVSVLPFDEAEVLEAAADGRALAFSRVSRCAGVESAGTVGCAFKAAEISGD